MVDFGYEADLRGLERVLVRELNREFEYAVLVGRVTGAVQSDLPPEEVVLVDGSS